MILFKYEVSIWLEPRFSTASGRLHVYTWSITNILLINSSINIILCLIRNVEDRVKKGLCDILFGVHHVDVVWKFEVLKIGKLREGGNVSPVVRLTISFKTFFPFTFSFALVFACGFAFAFAFSLTGRLKSF